MDDKFTVRPVEPNDADAVADFLRKESSGGDTKPTWVPLGLTLDAWEKQVRKEGEEEHVFVLHSSPGTLLHTSSGIYTTGMIGFFQVGTKLEADRTINREGTSLSSDFHPDKDIIISYYDPPYPPGCKRLPDGRIHCECESDY